MNFTTRIPISKSDNPINYHSQILSVGSCFAVNIAGKFEYFQFRHTVNPFGILFHPIAIENFLHRVADNRQFQEDDIFFHNESWHSFEAHSQCSSTDRTQMVNGLNHAVVLTQNVLKTATHVIITLGTAWVYRNVESGRFVANCHKVPQRNFTKELLSVDSIAESLERIIAILRDFNKEVNIVFTVSPVRHIKDGFVENQWSKANLISALYRVLHSGFRPPSYFPSYEIVMDELRDYRFYADDMLHPSQTAIDYIWERFVEVWIEPSIVADMEEVASIKKNLAHRPFNHDSQKYHSFLKATGKRAEDMIARFPHMKF